MRQHRRHGLLTLVSTKRRDCKALNMISTKLLSSAKWLLVGIRAVFAWGTRMELIARNPAANVAMPRVAPREYPDFSREMLQGILAAVDGTEFHLLVPFALMTGIRRGELAALRRQDIDLKRGRYSVRRSAAILDGKQVVKTPKSPRSRRTEALPKSLIVMLDRHLKEQAKRFDRLGLGDPEGHRRV